MPGLVGDLQDHPEIRKLVQHLCQRRRERRMDHHGARLRVGQQVQQLLGHVAVVDVERGDAGLERTEHRLEVFVAVVEVDRQVVLAALVAGEIGSLGCDAEALADQMVREATGALGDLGPRVTPLTEDEAIGVRP